MVHPSKRGKIPKTRDKTSLKLGDCYPSKQGDTKDTITKEKRKDYSSENSGESSDQPENDLSVVKPVRNSERQQVGDSRRPDRRRVDV